MLNLNDREWKAFNIENVLGKSYNSKAYHSRELKESKIGIPYITRTSLNNGLYSLVKINSFITAPKKSISFGAENAEYFYQPYEYITGNKMYYYKNENINLYSGLFIIRCLNNAIKNCGFGYGMGLTGSRSDRRKVMLPATEDGRPDYAFMEQYIREREDKLKQKYSDLVNAEFGTLPISLAEKEWKEFSLADIFIIKSGKRLTTADMDSGNLPFIGATELNNGVTNWINTPNETLDYNVLGVNYNGSVAEAFYHPYSCVFSDDVKRLHLKNTADGKYILLFLGILIRKQKVKYTYGYKFNGNRMAKQKILLPVTDQGNPDYAYMEQYIKAVMFQKYKSYLEYQNYRKP